MYFKSMPYTFYTLDDYKTAQLITNIMTRVVLSDEAKNLMSAYDEYDIKDGETPEILAAKLYNDANLHWIILHVNEIIDPRYEWPLSTNNLLKYCQSKYTNINGVHHYEDLNGNIVNSTAPGAIPVTNYIYEDRVNEGKRRIKILKRRFVGQIVAEFKNKVSYIV